MPQEAINFFDLDVELYLKDDEIRDFDNEYRAISHAQIELIAGRTARCCCDSPRPSLLRTRTRSRKPATNYAKRSAMRPFCDAAATVASFNAVVKLADGTVIPLEDYKEGATRNLRADLGPDHLRR